MPVLAASTFQYTPSGSPWQFAAGTGSAATAALRQSRRPRRHPGRVDPGQRQHERVGVPGLRGLRALVPWPPNAAARPRPIIRRSKSWSTGCRRAWSRPPARRTQRTRRPPSRRRRDRTPSPLVGLNPLGGDNTAFVDRVALLSTTDSINDASFEVPGLAAGAYQYAPDGSPWQFAAGAGVCSNGSVSAIPMRPTAARSRSSRATAPWANRSTWTPGPTRCRCWPPNVRDLSDPCSGNPSAGRRRASRRGQPTGTSYGPYQTSTFTVAGGDALDYAGGAQSAGRRQHRLCRPVGDCVHGGLVQRRQLRVAGAGRRRVPVHARWFALAVCRGGRGVRQRQRLRQPRRRPTAARPPSSKATAA